MYGAGLWCHACGHEPAVCLLLFFVSCDGLSLGATVIERAFDTRAKDARRQRARAGHGGQRVRGAERHEALAAWAN